MSMLAQRKRKQKIGPDPQNKAWANDSDKFGQKLLEKFGWKEGMGLGATNQGNPDCIKSNANVDGRGLGSDFNPDDTWLGHQDDFDDLLKSLNSEQKEAQGPSKTETHKADGQSLEHISQSSRARIHYHKFARGKDLSSKASDDVGSIFGLKKRAKNRRLSVSKDSQKSSSSSTEANHFPKYPIQTSNQSVDQYFAKKLEKLKSGTMGNTISTDSGTNFVDESAKNDEEMPVKKRKKKNKK